MFDYLPMAYIDFTIMFTFVHWNSPWWWSYERFYLPINWHYSSTLLWRLMAVLLLGKTHKDSDYTAMIATLHWCLCAETHPGGEVL